MGKDLSLNILGVSFEGDIGNLVGFVDTHRRLSSWPSSSALKGKNNDNVIIAFDVSIRFRRIWSSSFRIRRSIELITVEQGWLSRSRGDDDRWAVHDRRE